MKKGNIIFICALLIFGSFVFSPVIDTADAIAIKKGKCRTSKWGITAGVEVEVIAVRSKVFINSWDIKVWRAKSSVWGKGAKFGSPAIIHVGMDRIRIKPQRGYVYHVPRHPSRQSYKRGTVMKARYGINMYRGSKKSRQRCTLSIRLPW